MGNAGRSMTEAEMKALLTVMAYDCRAGGSGDHYYRTFESRRFLISRATLSDLRAKVRLLPAGSQMRELLDD